MRGDARLGRRRLDAARGDAGEDPYLWARRAPDLALRAGEMSAGTQCYRTT